MPLLATETGATGIKTDFLNVQNELWPNIPEFFLQVYGQPVTIASVPINEVNNGSLLWWTKVVDILLDHEQFNRLYYFAEDRLYNRIC